MKPWLLVEDEDDIRNIVKVMFGVWGHETLEFRDGNEAWSWLDSVAAGTHNAELPEFALMDIRMPGHKGHEIAQRMRTVAAFKHIPIILMTAFSLTDSERQEMLRDFGVDHIIHKPLPDFFELKQLLDHWYDKKKAQATSKHDTPPPSAPSSAEKPEPSASTRPDSP